MSTVNGKLDVEVRDGRVVSVWFNCQMLPFEQWDVDGVRAKRVVPAEDALTADGLLVEHVKTSRAAA